MTTSTGGDSIRLPLGPLDHIAGSNIPQTIIYLSLKSGVPAREAFDYLHAGLLRTVAREPWLAGRVHRQSQDTPGWRPGQLEICYDPARDPSSLLQMKELDTTWSFADLKESGFELDVFNDDDLLWTSPFNEDYEAGVDVFAAQANFVPGGCLLVLSIAPPASDGTAMLNVTKLWADHCSSPATQGKNASGKENSFTADRAVLDPVWSKTIESANDQSLLHKLVGLHNPGITVNGHQSNGTTFSGKPILFYMPQTAYSALRKECISEPGRADVSGNDLICAMIWRSVVRAWVNTKSDTSSLPQQATVTIPFDARPDLTQSLKTTFLGCMNFENNTTLRLDKLIAKDTSVSWVARQIRANAAICAQPANLLSAYHLLQKAPEYSIRDTQIRASRMLPDTASVGILSPMVLPFNDTYFGRDVFGNDGKPESFRPMMGTSNRCYRTCFVVPRKQHGGIEFVMTLSEQETDFLREDEEFGRYAFPLS